MLSPPTKPLSRRQQRKLERMRLNIVYPSNRRGEKNWLPPVRVQGTWFSPWLRILARRFKGVRSMRLALGWSSPPEWDRVRSLPDPLLDPAVMRAISLATGSSASEWSEAARDEAAVLKQRREPLRPKGYRKLFAPAVARLKADGAARPRRWR